MDFNTGLTQVLSDGTNTYTYGLGRLSQQSGSTAEYFPSTGSRHRLGDALGSVRQLTDQYGEVNYAKSYDPYGVVTQSGGAGQSAYGFTGEQQSNDMVYLRARYYNPADGRFMSRDTWGGSYNSPQSLNKWNYTQSNPINYADPTGHIPTPTGSQMCGASTLSFGIATLSLSAQELVDLCKDFYSQKFWKNFSLPGGIGSYDCASLNAWSKPVSAAELYGDYICERGPEHVYFSARDTLTKKLVRSVALHKLRKEYYQNGAFGREEKFGDPLVYVNEWKDLITDKEFPLVHIMGSFDISILPTNGGRIRFEVNNRTDLASGTHFIGRFPPEGQELFPTSLEKYIKGNPDKGDWNAAWLINTNSDLVSILSPRSRSETGLGMGGGNFRQTFSWTENNIECWVTNLPWPAYLYFLNIGTD